MNFNHPRVRQKRSQVLIDAFNKKYNSDLHSILDRVPEQGREQAIKRLSFEQAAAYPDGDFTVVFQNVRLRHPLRDPPSEFETISFAKLCRSGKAAPWYFQAMVTCGSRTGRILPSAFKKERNSHGYSLYFWFVQDDKSHSLCKITSKEIEDGYSVAIDKYVADIRKGNANNFMSEAIVRKYENLVSYFEVFFSK